MNTETFIENEVARFLAGRPTPAEIITFRPSEAVTARVRVLLAAERDGQIQEAERHELDTYEYVEHLMRLIKAEAHRQLGQQAS